MSADTVSVIRGMIAALEQEAQDARCDSLETKPEYRGVIQRLDEKAERAESQAAALRAALACMDAEHELADLHDSIRTAYAQCPQLPISAEHPEDFDKATDALHSLCLLVGIHGIEVTRAVTVEGKGNAS